MLRREAAEGCRTLRHVRHAVTCGGARITTDITSRSRDIPSSRIPSVRRTVLRAADIAVGGPDRESWK